MVRLKGIFYLFIGSKTKTISIPYGAIKRSANRNNGAGFQRISIPYGAIKSG